METNTCDIDMQTSINPVTETVEQVESTETTESNEQVESVEDVESTETTEDVEPTEQVETTETTEQVEPIESVEDVESTETTEQVEPIESVEDVESNETSEYSETCETASMSIPFSSRTYDVPHCRSHCSNMMFSHIFMIIPCIWWICIDVPDTDASVFYSKIMAIIMTASIIFSYIYHYYYECILCYAEQTYIAFAIISLNIYMLLRNVSILYILPGGILLFALKKCLHYCNSDTLAHYETYHPFCHYIAGLYIFYCVWCLRNAQHNMFTIDIKNVLFNDVYSGINYQKLDPNMLACTFI